MMAEKRAHRVLVIAERFPPLGSAGASIRLVKFLKYLEPRGWTFTVATTDPDRPPMPVGKNSGILEKEIAQTVEVVHIKPVIGFSKALKDSEPRPKSVPAARVKRPGVLSALRRITKTIEKWLLIPDAGILWVLGAFFPLLKLMRKRKYDLLFCVIPPHSSALLGALLSKVTNTPLVYDIKDDWVDSPEFFRKPAPVRSLEKLLEAQVVRQAARMVAVTQNSHRLLQQRYPGLAAKIYLIPNGCDIEEYLKAETILPRLSRPGFLIVSGAAGYQRSYRDAAPFLYALKQFFTKRPEAASQTQVHFLGNSLDHEYDSLIDDLQLSEAVRRLPPLERQEFIQALFEADLFFLIQPYHNSTAISATLYEYWAVGSAPILLISEAGASKSLIDENKLGAGFGFEEIDAISSFIESVYDAKLSNKPITITRSGIERFDRRALTDQLDIIFRECLNDE